LLLKIIVIGMVRKNTLLKFLNLLLILSFTNNSFIDYSINGENWRGKCLEGKSQSPINIKTNEVQWVSQTYFNLFSSNKAKIDIDEKEGQFVIKSEKLGEVFFYLFTQNEQQHFNEYSDYYLSQMFIHSPSEHKIDYNSFDLEIQILGKFNYGSLKYKYIMFSLLFLVGNNTSQDSENFFKQILNNKELNIDIKSLLDEDLSNKETFMYEGSLTTPPCEEEVLWFVFKTPRFISTEILDVFKKKWEINEMFSGGKGNNRKTQLLNHRVIYSNINSIKSKEVNKFLE
jgi:carbonic anhydrase